MGKLAGKTALITGGARSIGAAAAHAFAREGANVLIGDVLDAEGRAVADAICAQGGKADYFHLDVTEEANWQAAVERACARFGQLTILLNNAGIASTPASIEQRSADEWDRVMAINVRGVFLGIKHAIPAMRRAGGGTIINMSSVRALGQFRTTDAAYAASKGAVRTLTKVVAGQCAVDKIRCNSIHPGPIDTALLRAAFPDPASLAQRLSSVPLGRAGTLDEIVAAILYFASDESAFTTGAELVIDGGALVD
jgi:NAD(P)-dependent dehydrogenase (short-subunit alcohol dehydrogenase family)